MCVHLGLIVGVSSHMQELRRVRFSMIRWSGDSIDEVKLKWWESRLPAISGSGGGRGVGFERKGLAVCEVIFIYS